MQQTNTRSILRSLEYAPPVQDLPFVERHAGVLLSVALHAGLFAMMFMQLSSRNFETTQPDQPKPIIVQLAQSAPAERTEAGGAAEVGQPMIEESVEFAQSPAAQSAPQPVTQSAPEMTELAPPLQADSPARQILQAVEKQTAAERAAREHPPRESAEPSAPVMIAAASPQPVDRLTLDLPKEPPTRPSPPRESDAAKSAPAQQAKPSEKTHTLAMELTEEAKHLLAELEASRKTRNAANRVEGYQGSGDVAHLLNLIEAEQVAQKTLFTERGLRKGVVRTFVADNVDPNIAQQVFEKYGFKTFLTDTSQTAQQNGAGYLNSATTHQGKFVQPAGGKGLYQIFTYPDSAMVHLSRLEDAALKDKGMEPEYSRVIAVTFGVVSTTKGYDLGVLKLQAEPIPH